MRKRENGETLKGIFMGAEVVKKNSVFTEANKKFKTGDYEGAARLYKRAIQQGGPVEMYWQNMIIALRRAALFDVAARELYSSLAKKPTDPLLVDLLDREKRAHLRTWTKPLLSIIVPVYNSGKYLRQCLESILHQSFKNFEVLVVNDGSTDNSPQIISEIAGKDSRVRVINNSAPSGNPGTPRNQALDLVQGAYIGFVDSDDWIEPHYYEALMATAQEKAADIVFSGGFFNRRGNEIDVRKYGVSEFSDSRAPNYKYHESFMIWDKVFNAKLIQSFRIRLGETKAAVDVPFIFKAYYLAHNVAFCPELIGYNYRRESDSSVTVNYRKSSDCNFEIAAYQSIEDWSSQEGVTDQYSELISYRKVSSFIYTLSVIAPKMFDQFYQKARTAFKKIDRRIIERYTRTTGKGHVLYKFDAVLNETPSKYRSQYRQDISPPKKPTKEQPKPLVDQQSFHLDGANKGIMFFPDWSKRNPYQKLMYASLAKRFDIRIKGYKEQLFSKELLEKNRDNFDCIHLHWLHVFMDFAREDGAESFLDVLGFARSLGYKIIYTAHNIISHDSQYKERERQFRRSVTELFDYVLVHGEYAKKLIVSKIGVDAAKVYVVPHGSYEGYYPNYTNRDIARKRFDIADDTYVYLFFGNVKGYKGVDALLDAYEGVRARHINTRLIIAGRIFEESTGQLIQSYVDKDPTIIFKPGFIEEDDAQYYFNATDMVVLPYKRILTSGAALLSFSYHKPIIAPRSGLIPEIVEDGKQGYLFSDYSEMEKLMEHGLRASRDNGKTTNFDFTFVNKRLRWSDIIRGEPFSTILRSLPIPTSSNALPKPAEAEYALIRILGNDMPFRHNPNQTLTNLEFTLKNESDFAGCVKLWILNRIIDSEKKSAIVTLLDKYGKNYVDIPYVAGELPKIPFCFEDLPVDHFKLTPEYDKLDERKKIIVDTAILKHKNNYIMNNNGARNKALEVGKAIAKWVLPWDGNCFVNDQAWESLTESIKNREDLQYHVVPMDRVLSNEDVIQKGYEPHPVEEPQIVFRNDAELTFDENLMYGLKPKVDLLKRLGVPGVWDKWTNLYPWKKHEVKLDKNSFNYAWSGWVARLFSGNQGQEVSAHERAVGRERGIVNFIRTHDIAEMFKDFEKNKLSYYNEGLLSELVNDSKTASSKGLDSTLKLLKENAEKFKEGPLYSVTTKTTLPPSGDIKDYWHPAPYAWPNPDTADGLPYIHKDGQRVPGTRMYEPESVKYDRTSIQRLFDETTTLALAGHVFEDRTYTERAYQLIKAWFINPETSMNPNLNFSQVVMGRNDNKGTASGLIETKDLYFLLDAVRLIKRNEMWTAEDDRIMNQWCSEFYHWLCTSEQGRQEGRAKNNHGNAYDLQVYALAAFLGDKEAMYDILVRAASRLKSHVEPDGKQPHELRRTTTAHYTAFNLHLWISLHGLIKNTAGLSLIDTEQYYGEHKHRSALKLASSWVLRHGLLPEWPFKQIDHFDKARYEHIYHSVAPYSPSLKNKYAGKITNFSRAKDVYFPHDGIAPYWKLSSFS